ncbi:MAG: 50S ribosomal protein L22 [Candidatus Portnoybacteria bacterium]|nr:50S ribosomal protein L22 [Candidatus Portnoybacteria bacterium]
MKVTAKLDNLRMSPRKVRLVANLVKGMNAKKAQAQLRFMSKKTAEPLYKLLSSAIGNAKHNFSLDENNLFISKLTVEAGLSLKRWLPRAMGRATPILKRTSKINLILDEKVPTKISDIKKKKSTGKEELREKSIVEKEEKILAVPEQAESKTKPSVPAKPYGASTQSKKRFFSRQTFGNMKKVFRRKSI